MYVYVDAKYFSMDILLASMKTFVWIVSVVLRHTHQFNIINDLVGGKNFCAVCEALGHPTSTKDMFFKKKKNNCRTQDFEPRKSEVQCGANEQKKMFKLYSVS